MMAMIYIQQNTTEGRNIPYTNPTHKTSTIASSGCGCCSSLMVLLNCTSYKMTLKEWAKILMNKGARWGDGTDMLVVGKIMTNDYGFQYSHTTDIEKLKAHLKAGYKAVLHCGEKGYFSSGGHFVCVAGITKDDKAIILDPSYYAGKWTTICKGINRAKYFTYNSATHEVYCDFSTIVADSRGYKYHLFKPTKKKYYLYSSFDIWANWKNDFSNTVTQPIVNNYDIKYVNVSNTLNIRNNADIDATRIGSLNRGDKVTVYATKNGWSKISVKENKWVSSAYLSDAKPTTTKKVTYKTTVGKTYKLKKSTTLYDNSKMSGTKYQYKANTTVKVIKHITTTVDYVYIPANGKYRYCEVAAFV